MDQGLLSFPEHLCSPPVFDHMNSTSVFCGGRLVIFFPVQYFVDNCVSLRPISFVHCNVCPASTYGFFIASLVSSNFFLVRTTRFSNNF